MCTTYSFKNSEIALVHSNYCSPFQMSSGWNKWSSEVEEELLVVFLKCNEESFWQVALWDVASALHAPNSCAWPPTIFHDVLTCLVLRPRFSLCSYWDLFWLLLSRAVYELDAGRYLSANSLWWAWQWGLPASGLSYWWFSIAGSALSWIISRFNCMCFCQKTMVVFLLQF